MMNNIISIDLDKLNGFLKYISDEIKVAQVPTPCTLTDAVEKLGVIWVNDFDNLKTKGDVERFKREYLYKEETLEDGIYEVKFKSQIICVYICNGSWGHDKKDVSRSIDEIQNCRKIADL